MRNHLSRMLQFMTCLLATPHAQPLPVLRWVWHSAGATVRRGRARRLMVPMARAQAAAGCCTLGCAAALDTDGGCGHLSNSIWRVTFPSVACSITPQYDVSPVHSVRGMRPAVRHLRTA